MAYLVPFVFYSTLWGIASVAGWLLYHRVKKRPVRNKRRWVTLLVLLLVAVPVLTQSEYMFLTEPLVEAASDGDVEMVNGLLNRGANVNSVRDDGWGTPLLQAVGAGQTEMVRLLIRRGANVNKGERFWSDGNGWPVYQTPLQVAERRGHPEIVALLRQAGATR